MRSALLLGAMLVCAVPALAQDKATIERLNANFSAALAKGDGVTIAGMYTEDSYVLPGGSPMVKGRSSIQSFWTKASEGIGDMRLTTLDVKSLGPDAAREIGTYTLKTKGSQAQEVVGKYVVIWQ